MKNPQNKSFKLAMVSMYPASDGHVRGGVEGVAYALVNALLAEEDLDLHVLAPCECKKPAIEHRNGVTIHWLPMPKLPGFIGYWTSYRRIIQRCLAEINPDITHFQGVAGWTLGYSKPYVLTIHGINEKDVLFSKRRFRYFRHKVVAWVERRGRAKAKDIIVISPYVQAVLAGQIKGRCWSIENPVEAEFFTIKPQGSAPIVLCVGRINARKNIDGLIRAFRLVSDDMPEAVLRIAGPLDEKEYVTECRDLLRKLSLKEKVEFLGAVDRPALLSELSHAACLALVSHQETAPMIVEESMAAGVPVIASAVCGLPYMVEEGVTGFLVNQNNEREIADRIIAVLGNDKDSASIRKRSHEIALARFHSSVVAKKTLKLYRTVLDESAVPGTGI